MFSKDVVYSLPRFNPFVLKASGLVDFKIVQVARISPPSPSWIILQIPEYNKIFEQTMNSPDLTLRNGKKQGEGIPLIPFGSSW